MKTLVIHPKDTTTDFLRIIYADNDWTVINLDVSRKVLKTAIKEHDRIIMLGHGTEDGLLGFGKYIINSSAAYALKNKECICIWCNADSFVRRYQLKGFYTGMIISEYEEAIYCCVKATIDEISESNLLFSDSVKDSINLDSGIMLSKMKNIYKSDTNNVIMFNANNLYKA